MLGREQGAATVNVTANGSTSNIENHKLDALGEFIRSDAEYFCKHGGWNSLFHHVKGCSNFSKHLNTLQHQARPFLQRYARHGVPVVLQSPPWSLQKKDQAIQRGNHPSTVAFADFIRTEMLDMREKGMFTILPYHLVRSLVPLRLSPLGCVPQRERRPRIINDYTFSGINPSTVKMAPQDSMQWGKALHRVLWFIFHADTRHGPVLLSKTDLSDGFYQLHLNPSSALKLAVPFNYDGQPLVAIPTRLPMGWTESPPAFSAVTETIADVVNSTLESQPSIPRAHPLESSASTPVPVPAPTATNDFPILDTGPIRPRLAYVDVYVDDFIKLAQGWRNAMRVRRHTFHAIDRMFQPNDDLDHGRKEPISQKKLAKGDDHWSTHKTILGWAIDTARMTISLPPHRKKRLLELLSAITKQKRVSLRKWHKLLGELRSMSLALPGSEGCFSLLQTCFQTGRQRLKITTPIRDQLKDFLWLAQEITSRPTHLSEIVPTPPTYYGAMDAAKEGMGGVWFPPLSSPLSINRSTTQQLRQPILWRVRFPEIIQSALVSTVNPTGHITNSDLELAGAIAHDDILATALPVTSHVSSCSFSDNTPTVAWKAKGSTTTTGPAAYLLQLSALHRRHFRYCNTVQHLSERLLENAPATARDAFSSDLRLAQETVAAGVVPSRNKKAERTWAVWLSFCTSINVDPFLSTLADPVPILQTFGLRWRDGRISPSKLENKARSVEDAIRLVCQKFSSLGAKDPRLNASGKQDFRLIRMYAAWKKEDDPPKRVEPVPMPILLRAAELAGDTTRDTATMDCIWLAFYFLLRPGEYANATGDAKHPFRLKDVQLKIGSTHVFDVLTCPIDQLHAATYVSLTFTTQKNGVKGERMAHVANGQLNSCPVRATVRRIIHLRQHNSPATTPLHVYYDDHGVKRSVSSAMITSLLRAAALTIPGHAGVEPTNIAARSLRSSGAMALLLGGVNPDKIRILGRWRSDAMFRYLHGHALPLVQHNSRLMFSGGHYTLAPS